ncbi:MAG TPA: ABATE domain-containing protein [Gemmatimonadota bacterium]|nr:ABATE domain-containing protein [Gemmatimonadota bacterium]
MNSEETAPLLAPDGSAFDLSGGRLCLDFVNTVDGRLREPRDRLGRYADLVSWAEQAGAIEAAQALALREEASQRPQDAQRALAAARALREALFAILSSSARGESPPADAVAELNDALPGALSALRLAAAGHAFEWRWSLAERGLDRAVAPVIRDAAELLTSADLARVTECESESCAWLFLDQSRNRSRRWCDMSVCGNRAKARRHYRRTKRAT